MKSEFNFSQLPRKIKYKTWEWSNGSIVEEKESNWTLMIFKDPDDFWNVGYNLYTWDGASDRLPKSMTLKEALESYNNGINWNELNFIGLHNEPEEPNYIIHGIRSLDLQEACEKLLKWLYEEGLL